MATTGRADVGTLLDLSVRGDRGMIANLHRYDDAIVDEIIAENIERGDAVHANAVARAPVDRGFMQQHVELRFSDGGLAFEVGYDDKDFAAAGLPPYFVFQELGFHHYITGQFIRNAHLEPAFRDESARYRSGIRRAVQGAIARLGRGPR